MIHELQELVGLTAVPGLALATSGLMDGTRLRKAI